jgi:hypothetical protein
MSVDKLPEVANTVAGTVKGLIDASQQVGTITPLAALATPATLQASSNKQRMTGGGDDLNVLPYTLLGTVAFISVAGFAATYYRSKKNVKQADDSPPEPGVFRKPHQEKSTGAA